MIDFPYLKDIVRPTDTRIVMLVVDGLGGAPHPESRLSELETARIPNLDRLARESACGLTTPVLPGIAPGSGPGHLALFGYDPLKYLIGRGVLEALGIDLEVRESDVTARGNFCTVDREGRLMDRRGGRIPSEEAKPLCEKLSTIRVEGVDLAVHHVKEYRFVLLLQGAGLSPAVTETDPQQVGVLPLSAKALEPAAETTAQAVNSFVQEAATLLNGRERANMLLLRGLSKLPTLPPMGEAYSLHPAAIAAYPMYRGLAKVVGMEVISTGSTFAEEVGSLLEHFHGYDFFFIHYKPADAAGEDGNFQAKVQALEALDAHIPDILSMNSDVLLVVGDHATPSILAGHSWHPVPLLLHSPWTRGEGVERFTERACAEGSLGRLPATQIMLLAMAHAGKLTKFGP